MLKDKGKDIILYDNVEPNPSTNTVDNGAKLAVSKGCDVVIGLGGGSAIDSAKAIALVAGNGGNIWEYIEGKEVGSGTLPIVAIPTTAGTGSEANCFLVVTNKERRYKEGLASNYINPVISILDPKLTESLPNETTLDTGLDALGHSLESYLSKVENALSEIFSLNSIWLIFNYLPRAIKNGKDKEARGALMLAATMGGIAINHGYAGAPHAIAMSLGGLYNVTHGRAVGIILPYAVERARTKIVNKLSILTDFLGISKSRDKSENAKHFITILKKFIEDLNFPTKLRDIGIKKKNITEILNSCVGYEDFETDPASYSWIETKRFLEKII